MTLNASGPISLGGATTGQSVNLELGTSATATVSLNDAHVRVLTNTTAGTTVSLPTNFYGQTYIAPTATYLYTTNVAPSGPNPDIQFPSVGSVSDASGNTYFVGTYYNATSPNSYIGAAKINSAGAIVWQKYYTLGYAAQVYGQGMATGTVRVVLDASNNLIFGYYNSTSPNNSPGIIKIDSNGTFVWAKEHVMPGTDYGFSGGVQTDGSGNLYAVGTGRYSGTTGTHVTKYNSTGTVLWQKFLTTPNFQGYGFVTDSSGNTYIYGSTDQSLYSSTLAQATITKLDTNGSTLWSKYYVATASGYPGANVSFQYFSAGAISSSGDLYCSGLARYYNSSSGFYDGYISTAKINTSTGALDAVTAQKARTSSPNNTRPYSLVTDSSNNVYVSVPFCDPRSTPGYFNYSNALFKLTSTLASVAYQYRFTTLNNNTTYNFYNGVRPAYVAINKNSLVFWDNPAASGSPTYGPAIYRLPNDGSYFGSDRYFYPPATTTGYLWPDAPSFPTDSTYALTANTTTPANAAISWSATSKSPGTSTMAFTALTTTY